MQYVLDNVYIGEDNRATQPSNGILNKYDATVAPTVNEDSGDGYEVGSEWIDVTADKAYKCLDATVGAAVWTETTQSGGSGALEYQTEITVNTTLDGTQKGLNKVYPVNSTTAKTITITTGDYVLNDVINIERRGQGTVEIIADTGVRIRGKRDINNRYFINDVNSIAALLCRGSEEFGIIGELTRGYTGAVTTSSYSALLDTGVAQDVTVIGTGFSSNMLDPVLTGNATLNSWVFVNNNQITLNITETGTVSDTITVTYDNGDVFVDTDAITIAIALPAYNTGNLRHYYPLSINSDDAIAVSPINGTDASMTYTSGYAIFDGSASYIDMGDDDTFSYGNGSTDEVLSFSFTVNFDDTTPIANGRLISKWSPSTSEREYSFYILTTGKFVIQFF